MSYNGYSSYPPAAPYYPPQQPGYPAQRAYGGPSHYGQPPPPAYHAPVDPFRAYYADRLRELTFNSRPIIQELSLLAMQQRDQNQWGNMTAVVEEIEVAVYRVRRPKTTLPR